MPPRANVDRSVIPAAVLGLCDRLAQRNHRAWIVGGCVRDHLLDRPVSDWDLCTTAPPDELLRTFPRAIPTGIQHGTVTVMVDRVPYEVTTLRGETTYSDGRRPDAVFYVDDIVQDLARRDFTVNAIAYDPRNDTLVDPFDGVADLGRRVLRAVGDASERFAEDGLRVLRAARFTATLDFALDPATERAIEPNLATFKRVSPERVRDEWLKTMKAARPSRAFEVMRTTGILGAVCAPLLDQVGCTQNHYHQYDVWGHTMHVLDAAPVSDPVLRIAALVHDIAKPRTRELRDNGEATFHGHEKLGAEMAEEFLRAFRFSNEERDRVTHLVRHHLVAYDPSWTDAAVRRFVQRVGAGALSSLFVLCRADSLGKGAALGDDLARLDELRARTEAAIAAGAALTVKSLAINGNDLQRELGIPPSKRLGIVLDALLERVIDDPTLNTRDALLALARTLD